VIPILLARLLADTGLVLFNYDPRLPPFLARAIYLGKQVLEMNTGNRRLPRVKKFPFRGIPQG